MEPARAKHILGWCSPDRWKQGAVLLDEIVLTPNAVCRGPLVAAEVVVHELAHLANWIAGRRDTSRQGRYHNHLFRQTAELFGLEVHRDEQGWARTELGSALEADVLKLIRTGAITTHVFRYERQPGAKAPPSLVRLTAECGRFVYVTRGSVDHIRVRCDHCGTLFEA